MQVPQQVAYVPEKKQGIPVRHDDSECVRLRRSTVVERPLREVQHWRKCRACHNKEEA